MLRVIYSRRDLWNQRWRLTKLCTFDDFFSASDQAHIVLLLTPEREGCYFDSIESPLSELPCINRVFLCLKMPVPWRTWDVFFAEVIVLWKVPCPRSCTFCRGFLSARKCPFYIGALSLNSPLLKKCTIHRGVLFTKVSSRERCTIFRGVLSTRLSSLERCTFSKGVLSILLMIICTII